MTNKKVLFVLTGHDRLGSATDEKAESTGFHLSEASKPWRILTEAGIDVEFATPKGGTAPIDPSSKDLDDADNAAFLDDQSVKSQLQNSRSITDFRLDEFDAIYFPGGHGTMWDFPKDENVQNAVKAFYENGKVVAAVCHGPAALVDVKLSNGRYLVDGRTVSAFTDAEERAVDKDSVMPFLLSSRLAARGATLKSADNFKEAVSVDERLVTGQNPASAEGVGEAIRDIILSRKSKAA